jgi:hypothetical protein
MSQTGEKRLHNAKKLPKGVKTITITHPYHPEKGETYEYIGQVKYEYAESVKCADAHGKIKVFPITYTNLHTRDENAIENDCVMSVANLMSLKELTDSILCSRET